MTVNRDLLLGELLSITKQTFQIGSMLVLVLVCVRFYVCVCVCVLDNCVLFPLISCSKQKKVMEGLW